MFYDTLINIRNIFVIYYLKSLLTFSKCNLSKYNWEIAMETTFHFYPIFISYPSTNRKHQ